MPREIRRPHLSADDRARDTEAGRRRLGLATLLQKARDDLLERRGRAAVVRRRPDEMQRGARLLEEGKARLRPPMSPARITGYRFVCRGYIAASVSRTGITRTAV